MDRFNSIYGVVTHQGGTLAEPTSVQNIYKKINITNFPRAKYKAVSAEKVTEEMNSLMFINSMSNYHHR